jgi:hypothetical protein
MLEANLLHHVRRIDMKKYLLALTMLAGLSATPAVAGSNFHVGYYTPQPIYYAPPVAYHPVAYSGYYAPRRAYCPPRLGYGVGRGHYVRPQAAAVYHHGFNGNNHYVNRWRY